MKDWTLDKWVEEVWGLYGHHDRNRSVSNVWASLGIYVSNIAEGLRKARYDEVFTGLAHTFVWLAAFVAKCRWDEELVDIYRVDESLSDIVALKYPNSGSHCTHAPCICSVQRSLLEDLKDKQKEEEELRARRDECGSQAKYTEWASDQWVGMFKHVFENSYMPLPVESIGFHLAEEVGEVARAIRHLVHLEGREDLPNVESHGAKLEVKIEIADCMSWISALFLRARAVVESAGGAEEYFGIQAVPDFSDVLIKRFAPKGKFGCPKCDYANPCACALAIVKYLPESPTKSKAN